MKQIVITLSLLLTVITIYAQGSYKLDQKNGFNKFELGSDIKIIRDNTKLLKEQQGKNYSKNITTYTVKNIGEYKLFGYPLGKIRLIFFKNELLEIQVYLPDYTADQKERAELIAQDIGLKIEKEYGSFVELELTTQDKLRNISTSAQIVGKDVTLLLIDFHPKTYNYITTYHGMYYAFISRRVYNAEAEERDQSGL